MALHFRGEGAGWDGAIHSGFFTVGGLSESGGRREEGKKEKNIFHVFPLYEVVRAKYVTVNPPVYRSGSTRHAGQSPTEGLHIRIVKYVTPVSRRQARASPRRKEPAPLADFL